MALASGLLPGLSALTGVAQLLNIDVWNLQDASYNGVFFHCMTPTINTVNPAAYLTQYLLNNANTPPPGTFTFARNVQDSVAKKLVVTPVPNMDGDYLREFGLTSSSITITGIMIGQDYLSTMALCNQYFMDTPTAASTFLNPFGNSSKGNYRVLVHPVFGTIRNVFFSNFTIKHDFSLWRAVMFELQLIAADPSYMSHTATLPAWQQDIQDILNLSEGITTSITQSFSLIQGFTNSNLPLPAGPLQIGLAMPLISSQGLYLSYIEKVLESQLINISNVFISSIAFFVQNNGGVISNSYWSTVQIDYTLLPIFTTNTFIFGYADAQLVINSYVLLVNTFIDNANANNYDFFLNPNLQALKNSVIYMDEIAKGILLQGGELTTIQTNQQIDLLTFLVNNNISIDKYLDIMALNNGIIFNACMIPAGTYVQVIA